MTNSHATHGRGTIEEGPEESDCACRGTPEQAACAAAGCGFCLAAEPCCERDHDKDGNCDRHPETSYWVLPRLTRDDAQRLIDVILRDSDHQLVVLAKIRGLQALSTVDDAAALATRKEIRENSRIANVLRNALTESWEKERGGS